MVFQQTQPGKILTWEWMRFFLTTATPGWLMHCESNPVKASFLWRLWELAWPLPSNCLFCKFPEAIPPCIFRELETRPLLLLPTNEVLGFVAIGSSTCIRSFTEYLSLTRYNSILCLSTTFMSSLTYWRSFCVYRKGKNEIHRPNYKSMFKVSTKTVFRKVILKQVRIRSEAHLQEPRANNSIRSMRRSMEQSIIICYVE